MLEAKDGYYFLDSWRVFSENVRAETDGLSPEALKAVHGYDPDKEDYATIFMAKGAGIAKSVRIDKMSLIDEGPTLAKLLGVDLGEVDGHVIGQMLE